MSETGLDAHEEDPAAGQGSDGSEAGSSVDPDAGRGAVLLLSGGMDSGALAAWLRPDATLFVDYGQRPAAAEGRASRAVAAALGLPYFELCVDLSPVGSGLLLSEAAGDSVGSDAINPSPEWWPLRNQLLASIAAAWALSERLPTSPPIRSVLVASVLSDGTRHVDGTADFYRALDAVTAMQEGGVRVSAPAVAMTTEDLVRRSAITASVLGWCHSCHRSDMPCAACPGCWKREQVLTRLGMLGYGSTDRASA